MKANSIRAGRCALTGREGDFIDCHIIPRALTQKMRQGQPLMQEGRDGRFIRRWTSWYDPKLVTQAGEDILQSYDDVGIRILRRHRLVWSSWGPMLRLPQSMYTSIKTTGHGFREITLDAIALRLFFLSILWRGIATKLWEFDRIALPEADTQRLRDMVLHGNPEPYDFLSISLMQFTTQTAPFNHAIVSHSKRIPDIRGDQIDFEDGVDVKCFRVYTDGLIANINIDLPQRYFGTGGQIYLTDRRDIIVQTLDCDRSAYISRINFKRGLPVNPDHLEGLLREVGAFSPE